MKQIGKFRLAGIGLAALLLVAAAISAKPTVSQAAPAITPPPMEQGVNDGKPTEPTPTPEPSVVLPGWAGFVIEADTTDVTVRFYNPDKNEGNYYLTFELLIETQEATEDSEAVYESIYSSGLVPPGMFLTDITLSRPLPAGEYAAIVRMQPWKIDSLQPTANNGAVSIRLIAKGREELEAEAEAEAEVPQEDIEETPAIQAPQIDPNAVK